MTAFAVASEMTKMAEGLRQLADNLDARVADARYPRIQVDGDWPYPDHTPYTSEQKVGIFVAAGMKFANEEDGRPVGHRERPPEQRA